MYYFAYGSNMNSVEIEEYLRRKLGSIEKIERIKAIKLPGYKFAYNKKSVDGTGKANIYPYKNVSVYGVVFKLSKEQMTALDAKEKGYKRFELAVQLGSKKQTVISYTAELEYVNNKLLPSPEYKSKVIQAAKENKMPDSYIEQFIEN